MSDQSSDTDPSTGQRSEDGSDSVPTSVEEAVPEDVDPSKARADTESIVKAQTPNPESTIHKSDRSWLHDPTRRFVAWLATTLNNQTNLVGWVEPTVESADIDTPGDLYLSKAFSRGLVVLAVVSLLTFIGSLTYIVTQDVLTPDTLAVASLGAIGLGLGFTAALLGLWFSYVRYGVSERGREINAMMPDAVSYMYTQSVGGINHLDVIRSLAQAEDTYGHLSREFQAIVREAEYFGEDYQIAIAKQAELTPSDELSRFLTDMLTVLRSGGDLAKFLENETDIALRTAKSEMESTTDLLELAAEMYLTISLFPLIGIVVLVILSTINPVGALPLFAIVYGFIPLIALMFIVAVSGVRGDELGSGKLDIQAQASAQLNAIEQDAAETDSDTTSATNQRTLSSAFGSQLASDMMSEEAAHSPSIPLHPAAAGILNTHTIDLYRQDHPTFDKVAKEQVKYRTKSIFTSPLGYFRERPLATLPFTLTITAVTLTIAILIGAAPLPTPDAFIQDPLNTTAWWLHVPLFVVLGPLAIFYEYGKYIKKNLYQSFPQTLRKIASANDTGMTLLDSIESATSEQESLINRELGLIHTKAKLGMPMEQALVEFNNAYQKPKIARITNLLIEAQRTSEHIANVLQTAVQSAENRIQMTKEQKTRTQVQTLLIMITSGLILAVMMILDRVFLPILTEGGLAAVSNAGSAGESGQAAAEFGTGLDPALASLLFLHAVTLHAVFSGALAGYIREGEILSGVKYILVLLTMIFFAWNFV